MFLKTSSTRHNSVTGFRIQSKVWIPNRSSLVDQKMTLKFELSEAFKDGIEKKSRSSSIFLHATSHLFEIHLNFGKLMHKT